jgi:hypothetical protein
VDRCESLLMIGQRPIFKFLPTQRFREERCAHAVLYSEEIQLPPQCPFEVGGYRVHRRSSPKFSHQDRPTSPKLIDCGPRSIVRAETVDSGAHIRRRRCCHNATIHSFIEISICRPQHTPCRLYSFLVVKYYYHDRVDGYNKTKQLQERLSLSLQ